MTKPMIVGVAGGTGSGKTTLAKHIADAFGQNVTVIAHDSYYHLQVGKTYEDLVFRLRGRVGLDLSLLARNSLDHISNGSCRRLKFRSLGIYNGEA